MQEPLIRQSSPPSSSWLQIIGKILLFCLAFGFILAIFFQSYYTNDTINDQKTTIDGLKSSVDELSSVIKRLQNNIPRRFGLDMINPAKDQARRGTCWDFATIATLEDQYRRQAVSQGWWNNKNQFTQFSEQAYGNRVLKLCQEDPQPCMVGGDQIAFNSTDGGEIFILYDFREKFQRLIMPLSICPYINMTDDSSCPGLEENLPRNPISFKFTDYQTLYNLYEIKKTLVNKHVAMGWSSAVVNAHFYQPCDNSTKTHPDCQPDTCHICPDFYDRCCIVHEQGSYNYDGEFYLHRDFQEDGGHCMLLVGYNDDFRSRYSNSKGGFIIRNSWGHGVGHSLNYWLEDVSDADERVVCPNSGFALNWYLCGNKNDVSKSITDCLKESTRDFAYYGRQPLKLKCRNTDLGCSKDPNIEYFTVSLDKVTDELHEICVLEHHINQPQSSEIRCFGPMWLDLIGKIFHPVNENYYVNDPHLCGFFFWPYELIERIQAQLRPQNSFFVTYYKFEFDKSSFSAMESVYPQYDYNYLKESTHTQREYPIMLDPSPNTYMPPAP